MARQQESFEEELVRRDAELEAARANKTVDPETWNRVCDEYALWRRGVRMLGDRPLGDKSMWTDDVHEFATLHGLED